MLASSLLTAMPGEPVLSSLSNKEICAAMEGFSNGGARATRGTAGYMQWPLKSVNVNKHNDILPLNGDIGKNI